MDEYYLIYHSAATRSGRLPGTFHLCRLLSLPWHSGLDHALRSEMRLALLRTLVRPVDRNETSKLWFTDSPAGSDTSMSIQAQPNVFGYVT